MHYVYVLRSLKDGNLYTGYTSDLRVRIAAHNAGKARSTRDRRALCLIYYDARRLTGSEVLPVHQSTSAKRGT